MSTPIASWAYTDQYPVGYDFDNDTLIADVNIAIAAFENFEGINWVQFEFTAAAPVNLTDPKVTNPSGNNYRVSSPSWIDALGEGNFGQFWNLPLDLLIASHDDTYTVSEIRIQTGDLVEHTLILDGQMNARTIHIWRTPTIKYLDATLATGANDGTSWADAWQNHAAAVTGSTGSDIIKCRGTMNVTGSNYIIGKIRSSGWLMWLDDDGTSNFIHTGGNLKFADFNGLRGIDISMPAGFTMRVSVADHVSCRNMTISWPGWNSASSWSLAWATHFEFVNFNQEKGFRGFAWSNAYDVIVDGGTLNNSGTCMSGHFSKTLINKRNATNCALSDNYVSGTHFDFFHPIVSGTANSTDDLIIMGCSAYNNGGGVDNNAYNFLLMVDGFSNVAVMNNSTYNLMGLQQVLQIAQGNALLPFKNFQGFNNTLLALDTIAEGDERGFNVSGQGGSQLGGYGFGDLYFANNVTNTLLSTAGIPSDGVPEAPLADIPTHFTTVILGANFYSDQDETIPGLHSLNGSVFPGDGGNDDFDLSNLSALPPNLTPNSTSGIIPSNGDITPLATEAYFDADGNVLSRDGTDAVGAFQYVEGAVPEDTGRAGLITGFTSTLVSNLTTRLIQ